MLLGYDRSCEQPGHLDGKLPRQSFADFTVSGWRRADIDRHALEAAFTVESLRTVTRGCFTCLGQIYRHAALLKLTGRRVLVCEPLVGDRERLIVLDDDGEVLCVAEPNLAEEARRAAVLHPIGPAPESAGRVRLSDTQQAMGAVLEELSPGQRKPQTTVISSLKSTNSHSWPGARGNCRSIAHGFSTLAT